MTDRLEEIRNLAAQTREDMAAKSLGLDAVMALITKAAAEGQNLVTLTPARPADLRTAPTWIATAERLKEMGFMLDQRDKTEPDGKRSCLLTVSW